MVSRLEITHGLIPERDRVASSADTLSVTRPSTGSQIRSKGVLFVLASSTLPGPKAREATMLVADAIRREYYYDESAGVPTLLEKAVRNADTKLKGSGEIAGTLPGSVGLAVAVVRDSELYLATIGAVGAYLVRSARMLIPERTAMPGLPSEEPPTLDVWRGELTMGDSLLLVSENLTRTVGTEELKSAALTLHPQAAVEHLHHLFVAAGGEGSDGMIALETSDRVSTAASTSGRQVPAAAGQAYGDLPGVLPAPVGGAVGQSLVGVRSTLGAALSSAADRLWDTMPRRQASAAAIRSRMSRAESQRRIAMGLMALIGVVALLGTLVVVLPREGDTTRAATVQSGDSSLAEARDLSRRAANLVETQQAQALSLYRQAWDEVTRARATGLSAPALTSLEDEVRAGLDGIYGARQPVTRQVTGLGRRADPVAIMRGPRGAAYVLDARDRAVSRIRIDNGSVVEVATQGDQARSGRGRLGTPLQIESANREIVIVDEDRQAWRWRPSDNKGNGTLARLNFLGGAQWGDEIGDIATFPDPLGYRLYMVDPSRNQIMRYQQTFDGSAFQVPQGYLVTDDAAVADYRQVYIDGDVYALVDDGVRKFEVGRYNGNFALDEPPDANDLRPGFRYTIIGGTGSESTDGTLYTYDAEHGRIVAFSKVDGSYRGQWVPGPDDVQMDDVRGMYVVAGNKKRDPASVIWVSPEGVFESQLVTPRASAPASDDAPQKKNKKKNRRDSA